MPVGVRVPVGDWVGVWLGVGVAVPEPVPVPVGVGVADDVGVGVCVAVTLDVGDCVGVGVAVTGVGVAEGVVLGVGDAEAQTMPHPQNAALPYCNCQHVRLPSPVYPVAFAAPLSVIDRVHVPVSVPWNAVDRVCGGCMVRTTMCK